MRPHRVGAVSPAIHARTGAADRGMSDHAHGAPVPPSSGLKQPYHLVDPSPWPIIGAFGAA